MTFLDNLGPLVAELPFEPIPPLELGPLKFYPFGFLVGLAIIVGTVVAGRRAKKVGLDEAVIAELALWAVVPGMIVAHLYSAIFYFPEKVAENPLYLLKIWDGISSFGGFIGGAAGTVYYLKKHRIPFWPYADALMYGFVFAWIFGRMGCTVAYDHPGSTTDFFLGMPYPHTVGSDAAPAWAVRHNLGFYEMLWTLLMAGVFWANRNKPKFSGWFVAAALILYTPIRFALDFLRAVDETYLGLTPGHYAAIALLALGVWTYRYRKSVGETLVPDGAVHVFPDGREAVPAFERKGKQPKGKAKVKGKGRKPKTRG